MKTTPVSELTSSELKTIVRRIKEVLYLDMDEQGEFWSGGKQWTVDTIEHVAEVLDDYHLRPPLNKRSER